MQTYCRQAGKHTQTDGEADRMAGKITGKQTYRQQSKLTKQNDKAENKTRRQNWRDRMERSRQYLSSFTWYCYTATGHRETFEMHAHARGHEQLKGRRNVMLKSVCKALPPNVTKYIHSPRHNEHYWLRKHTATLHLTSWSSHPTHTHTEHTHTHTHQKTKTKQKATTGKAKTNTHPTVPNNGWANHLAMQGRPQLQTVWPSPTTR